MFGILRLSWLDFKRTRPQFELWDPKWIWGDWKNFIKELVSQIQVRVTKYFRVSTKMQQRDFNYRKH